MTTVTTLIESRQALQLTLRGQVQGIGMRPAIVRFAKQSGLSGYVANTGDGVEIHVEGSDEQLKSFQHALLANIPTAAVVSTMSCDQAETTGATTFSVKQLPIPCLAVNAEVPSDVVVCDTCLQELEQKRNRRHGYALTSCADCGPRYSIIQRMPYEREHTTMMSFGLCTECRQEYDSPSDRRFHAQTIACPKCGPQLWLRDRNDQILARSEDAVETASRAIREGKIVAMRGLGGYQLLVDATSQEAVDRLRRRKNRRAKPLAVMVATFADADEVAHLNSTERQELASRSGPIVVVRLRENALLAASVNAGFDTVGIMLPTTPLHWLLLKATCLTLVCTSGNLDGAPLVYDHDEAIQTLSSIADVWLEHDRPIQRPIDDSVVRVMGQRTVTLRAARGLAPLKLRLDTDASILALGGQQKAAIALCNGKQAVLGPHIGDMETVATRKRYVEQLDKLRQLYSVEACHLVGDLHPDYFNTQWAEDQAESFLQVQHHHAHVVAAMIEHGWLDRQVLGVAFDGTGYGPDGTIWGGELLVATSAEFSRVGHLRTFALAGGERAVREPWRVATALVQNVLGDEQASKLQFATGNAASLFPLLKKPHLSPITSSVGRLFDGVAALVLGIEQSEFEGQPAMLLEGNCDTTDQGRYEIAIRRNRLTTLDWRPLIRQLMCDRARGVERGAMAMRFHRGLAEAIVSVAGDYPALSVVLGGGVFQNRVLVELLADAFRNRNRPCGLPGLIPPGDGGLAAGQLAIAAAALRQGSSQQCV